jgi:RNA polymerase sigma factor (sigma-70 family)
LLKRSSGGTTDDVPRENEADELYIKVLEFLSADGHRPLREFQGRSSLESYLTTVICNLNIDMIRSRHGRDRRQERARQFDLVGETVYKLCCRGDYTLAAAVEFLGDRHGVVVTEDELYHVRDEIEGRVKVNPDLPQRVYRTASEGDDQDEIVPELVAGPHWSPEKLYESRQREERAREVLKEFTAGLSGTEQLVISARHPEEGEEPLTFREVASLVNATPKAVEHMYYRVLTKFRTVLLARGIGLDDLVEPVT